MTSRPKIGVIIVAGGSGKRAIRAGDDRPKQYQPLNGKSVLAWTIESFLQSSLINWVIPVIGPEHKKFYDELGVQDEKLLPACLGGVERQHSSLAGLEALQPYKPDLVLIHDGARPLVSLDLIERVCTALNSHDASLPALAVTDTIKRSVSGNKVQKTEDRRQLWVAQTPQGFDFNKILQAHKAAANSLENFTDDASIAEWVGLDVVLVAGDDRTIKITNQQDFRRAEMLLLEENQMETRVGSGMDIHQFEPGDKVRLGGVDIAHDAKLKGHSDADAALHVLTDALLGALAEGDIGTHFPPTDSQWKGEPSDTFLSFASNRVLARGGRIVHLDLTINCEAPKIGRHSAKIQTNIAKICGISPSRVSVKATTSEQMGFVGRREGLMTLGTATIEIPREEA